MSSVGKCNYSYKTEIFQIILFFNLSFLNVWGCPVDMLLQGCSSLLLAKHTCKWDKKVW